MASSIRSSRSSSGASRATIPGLLTRSVARRAPAALDWTMGRSNWSSRGGGRGSGRGRGGRGGRGRGRRDGDAGGVNFRDPGYNDGVQKGVDESVVGIRCFLKPDVRGFSGATKERYSDFVVREVALNGEVVQLRNVPRFAGSAKAKREQKISEVFKQRVFAFLDGAAKSADASAGGGANAIVIPGGVRLLIGKLAGSLLGRMNRMKREGALRRDQEAAAKLRVAIAELCGQEIAEGLEAFVLQLLEAQHAAAPVRGREKDDTAVDSTPSLVPDAFFFPEIADKDQRGQVHALIREFAGTLVVSDTAPDASGTSVIRVRKMMVNGKKRRDVDQRGRGGNEANKWPADRPDFLQFTLYKKNVETNSAMQQLARAMGVNVSVFSYAGTKDKRGITTQLCTIYRGSKERLEMLNRADRGLDEFNFLVGDATYVSSKLQLGDLRGNQFALAIRGLPSDDEISDIDIQRAVESWAQKGFINYFGLQRFGTKSIPTHEIGRAILQRDHQRAVELILQPQEGDPTKIKEVRQKFQDDGDTAAALRALPPYLVAERAVLQGLQSHGENSFSTALQCVPRHLRMMYTHAYQSYVWNTIASERLTNFSSEEVILGDLVLPASEQVTEEIVDEEATSEDEGGDEGLEAKKRRVERERPFVNSAIVVTEENRHLYSIYDVVLPLPGYDIMYPANALKQRYEELLAADGVDFQSLHRATNSEYHLPGSFRYLVKRPEHVKHEIKRYNDPTVALLETDVDRLLKRPAAASVPDAKFRALCLEFQLSPSSYATMAVRELLKQSSNIDAQPSRTNDTHDKTT